MPTKYAIDELDLSSRRSIDIEHADERTVVVRQFYHAGRFWKAVIPLDGVEAIYGQMFNFSGVRRRKTKDGSEVVYDKRGIPKYKLGIINHVQSRFQMTEGHVVKLFELDGDIDEEPEATIKDFVYSIEAVGAPGQLFDFKNGLSGTLMCAHRFLSMEEMVFERVVILGYHVRESPALPLSDDEKRTVLWKSLQRSDQAGLDETYYLYRFCGTNNCTSNPFQIIDRCVQYTWLQKLASLVFRLPLNPRLYLRLRGLDADPSYFGLVRNEFAEFIQDPATQKRKRAFVKEEIGKRKEAKKKGQ